MHLNLPFGAAILVLSALAYQEVASVSTKIKNLLICVMAFVAFSLVLSTVITDFLVYAIVLGLSSATYALIPKTTENEQAGKLVLSIVILSVILIFLMVLPIFVGVAIITWLVNQFKVLNTNIKNRIQSMRLNENEY